MRRRLFEQRNPYQGDPLRAWLRVTLHGPGDESLPVDLIADTGNPCPLIVTIQVFRRFLLEEAADVATNFGLLHGGWLTIGIVDVGFRGRIQAYGSDAVAAAASKSDPRFTGLIGLPLLQKLHYGGDSETFWVKRQRPSTSTKRR